MLILFEKVTVKEAFFVPNIRTLNNDQIIVKKGYAIKTIVTINLTAIQDRQ